jgi:hypothetical protein
MCQKQRHPHPYLFLDGAGSRDLQSVGVGKLKWHWLRLCYDEATPDGKAEIERDIKRLNSISLGELWAMPFMMRLEITNDRLQSKLQEFRDHD